LSNDAQLSLGTKVRIGRTQGNWLIGEKKFGISQSQFEGYECCWPGLYQIDNEKKMNKKIGAVASWMALFFGVVSALCWWRSSLVTVPHAHAKGSGLYHDGTIAVDGADLFKTLRAQARWSRWGATLATLSAIAQTVSFYFAE
jgi:hypothetical protein